MQRERENEGKEMGGVWSCGEVVEEKWVRESGKKNESQNGEKRKKKKKRGVESVGEEGWSPSMCGRLEGRRKIEKNRGRKMEKKKKEMEDGDIGNGRRYGRRENREVGGVVREGKKRE